MANLQQGHGSALPQLVGGRLCLDFTNTVEPRDGMAPNPRSPYADRLERREYLRSYSDLVAWGIQADTLSAATAQQLLAAAQQQPHQARAALARAVELRETIYRVFWRIASGATPMSDDMQALLHAVADTTPYVRLVARDEQLDWQWQADQALDQMVRPVLSDAVALLVRGDPNRIKLCPGPPNEPTCGWLFFDASKNCSRQWCSMQACGYAAKARRQTARRRAARKS